MSIDKFGRSLHSYLVNKALPPPPPPPSPEELVNFKTRSVFTLKSKKKKGDLYVFESGQPFIYFPFDVWLSSFIVNQYEGTTFFVNDVPTLFTGRRFYLKAGDRLSIQGKKPTFHCNFILVSNVYKM